MSTDIQQIVNRTWNFVHAQRDDGRSYPEFPTSALLVVCQHYHYAEHGTVTVDLQSELDVGRYPDTANTTDALGISPFGCGGDQHAAPQAPDADGAFGHALDLVNL